MIVPDALILARIVTCDVIEHCCVEVPTQHDVSICRDGVDVLKWRLNVSAIYIYINNFILELEMEVKLELELEL